MLSRTKNVYVLHDVYVVYFTCMLYDVGAVRGVTQLGDIIYVVCVHSSIIKTFTDILCPLADIHVEGMSPSDIVASHDDRHLYVADIRQCIWRISVDDHRYVKWLSTDVTTLSVTSRRLLVTSSYPAQLREYSTIDKRLLRVVPLPWYVYHGVETTRGTFVVCHSSPRGTGWRCSRDRRPASQYAVSELCSW